MGPGFQFMAMTFVPRVAVWELQYGNFSTRYHAEIHTGKGERKDQMSGSFLKEYSWNPLLKCFI